ncbi:hypothetical protein BCR33DRAFT_283575 [Rhizoclosmatium globosum]|nr:hypothetical protein BCR33DRAFT_283575 [Rhizoclosmatium globosum]|eukprot:ORY42857.1 hypothetical protein BCR33DRAFT_283575 [Rhizoclosmatium globosum]
MVASKARADEGIESFNHLKNECDATKMFLACLTKEVEWAKPCIAQLSTQINAEAENG